MFEANPQLFAPDNPPEDIILRGYQSESIEGLRANIRAKIDSQILAAFVGAGKTVMAAYLLREACRKGMRGTFVVDRLSLLSQTSAMFDRYGIQHGIIQSDHPRYFPNELIQIASLKTVQGRGWPKSDVIFFDECHALYKVATDRILMGCAKFIGLSATPFTRGLGRFYKAIVNVRTGNQLTSEGYLVPFRVFAACEPDMKGVKVVAGEWVEGETSERAARIVGNVVKEFLQHAGDKKGIAFGVDVAHCEELKRQFAEAGVVAELYTYRTPDDEREMILREFRKPASLIRLLISVSALSRGFDVPDCGVIVMCRPLKSSFSEFVQILGRGLRSHPDKTECIILDLAGNFMRHYGELMDFMENGCHELDNGKKKETSEQKPKPEKIPVKCPQCFHVFSGAHICPVCGHALQRKSRIMHEDGELGEFDLSARRICQVKQIFIGHILRRPDGNSEPASDKAMKYLIGTLGYKGPDKLTKQKCFLITNIYKKARATQNQKTIQV